MKKISRIISILLSVFILSLCFFSCAKINYAPITEQQLYLLEQDNAIADWKATCPDGCSSPFIVHMLSLMLPSRNWDDCCAEHDFDYRKGHKYNITKEQADYGLWECVNSSGHSIVANLMYDAVYWFGKSSYQKE